ncbi:MAG: hypothetical protein R3B47_18995 [Bacteroidia bacterium]
MGCSSGADDFRFSLFQYQILHQFRIRRCVLQLSDESSLDNPVVNNQYLEAGNGNTYSGAPVYTSPDRRGNQSYNDYYYADDDFIFLEESAVLTMLVRVQVL